MLIYIQWTPLKEGKHENDSNMKGKNPISEEKREHERNPGGVNSLIFNQLKVLIENWNLEWNAKKERSSDENCVRVRFFEVMTSRGLQSTCSSEWGSSRWWRAHAQRDLLIRWWFWSSSQFSHVRWILYYVDLWNFSARLFFPHWEYFFRYTRTSGA